MTKDGQVVPGSGSITISSEVCVQILGYKYSHVLDAIFPETNIYSKCLLSYVSK